MTIQEIFTEHSRDSSAPTDDPVRDLGSAPEPSDEGASRALQADEENASENTDRPEVHHLPLAEDDSPEVEALPTREAASSDEQPAPPTSHTGPDGGGPMSVSEAAENAQPVQGAASEGASSSQPDQGRLGSIDDAIENAQPVQSADETSADGDAQDVEVSRPEVTFPDEDTSDVEVSRPEVTFPDRASSSSSSAVQSNLIEREPAVQSNLIDRDLSESTEPGREGRGFPPMPQAPGVFPPSFQSTIGSSATQGVTGRTPGLLRGAPDEILPADGERFAFAVAGIQFLVVDFTARSGLSTPFRVDLSLALEELYPLDEVLGAGGTLMLEMGEGEQYINGIVNRFVQTGVKGNYRLFQAQLVPQMRLLGLAQDCRIFQEMTVPEIIRAVLEGAGVPSDGFEFRTRNNFMRRPYCVQYRESHLDFVSRLAEEEGLYYFFEHEHRNHKLVFGEGTLAYQRLEGNHTLLYQPAEGLAPEDEVVLELELAQQLQPTKVTLRDFDFKRPSLEMTAERDENRREENERQQRTFEWFDYPGRYIEPDLGNRYAAIRLQERLKDRVVAHGKSTCSRFLPGYIFELDCHDCEGANQEYVLVEVVHEGRQPQVLGEQAGADSAFSYANRFTAIPAEVAYAPARKTPKPMINGVQTAMVTGPRREVIYTDEYGRVKVRFHWDRSDSHGEDASCWIRVGQVWAGPDWGAMFIPRVGQEVMVEFEEGNPDRPIIVGRVYDGANMPPYSLPEEKTKSTIKSDSVGGSGFNEIRFEDQGGSEEIFIHAQKDFNQAVENDMETRVLHDQRLNVENDRAKTVQNNETIMIQNNRNDTVENDETVSIGGNRTTEVGRNEQQTFNGERRVTVGMEDNLDVSANRSVRITGNHLLNAGGGCTMETTGQMTLVGNTGVEVSGTTVSITAAQEIVLGVGANQIRLTAGGIEISGITLKTEASSANEIKGMPVMINC